MRLHCGWPDFPGGSPLKVPGLAFPVKIHSLKDDTISMGQVWSIDGYLKLFIGSRFINISMDMISTENFLRILFWQKIFFPNLNHRKSSVKITSSTYSQRKYPVIQISTKKFFTNNTNRKFLSKLYPQKILCRYYFERTSSVDIVWQKAFSVNILRMLFRQKIFCEILKKHKI